VHGGGEGVVGVLAHVNVFIGADWLLGTGFTTGDPNHPVQNDLQKPMNHRVGGTRVTTHLVEAFGLPADVKVSGTSRSPNVFLSAHNFCSHVHINVQRNL
jgi:hypothetical protein